jgi:hypothetical protein
MAAGLEERLVAQRREQRQVPCKTTAMTMLALKDANREDKAKSGAAVGMAAAGSRNRQDRRQDRRGADAWQESYDACLAQKPPQ